jgi:hypothetical protein
MGPNNILDLHCEETPVMLCCTRNTQNTLNIKDWLLAREIALEAMSEEGRPRSRRGPVHTHKFMECSVARLPGCGQRGIARNADESTVI